MLRVLLFFTGILSFIYFLRPDVFPNRRQVENTLGISTINQVANSEIVRQALLIHCINKQKLPKTLNQLYEDELSKDKFIDLDSMYSFRDLGDCQFELIAK